LHFCRRIAREEEKEGDGREEEEEMESFAREERERMKEEAEGPKAP
jgi:hypothetical protein